MDLKFWTIVAMVGTYILFGLLMVWYVIIATGGF